MLSCLGGELNDFFKQWHAGSEYDEGDAASLQAALEKYSTDLDFLKTTKLQYTQNGGGTFDRELSYQKLAEFICS
jgi:hypothetical protein